MALMNPRDVAYRAFARHRELHPLTNYTGILSLHAFSRLAVITGEEILLDEIRGELLPFIHEAYDKASFNANFTNYYCGGNGTTYLHWLGKLSEAEKWVRYYAEDAIHNAPRDRNGVFCHPKFPGEERIFIDVAFAETPFLLFAGLVFDEPGYIEESFQQINKMYHTFLDTECGLLHQCLNFRGSGLLSQDHWSRGNGWGLLALTELVNYLPAGHVHRPDAEQMFTDLVQACLRYQDADGLWHQEITDETSYVETSGTGLILYAIGVGLEKGLLPEGVYSAFRKGLRGYLDYIMPDGSVHHTCRGCLCPGQGRIIDYKARAPLLNDPHAF